MAIIAFMIGLSCLLSILFAKKYYYSELKNNLIATYDSCNKVFDDKGNCDMNQLYSILDNENDAMVYIVDDINIRIYTSVSEDTAVFNNLKSIGDFYMFSDSIDAKNSQIHMEEVEKYKNYKLQITRDDQTAQNYFDLIGYLDNGFIIIVRTSVARVDGTIKTTIKYFLMILTSVAVIGCILMYFFSNIFASPIKRLTNVAKRMAELDFDAKIENPSKDEIGELSIYMNELSFKLNETLTELKATNAKLQDEIDRKIKIDEMRKEFLSHVSHELKTPIALVQGYAEGLRDNINDDEESKNFYCDVIVDESNKMNKLVKQLLDLNEIEFGNNRLNKETFDIMALIKNSMNSTGILTGDKQVTIEAPEDDSIYVHADEFMIEEVFTNYLTNAIHYCKDNGLVKVWCEKYIYDTPVKADDDTDIYGNLRIYVYDEGPNIPEDELEKVFIKFYKVDKARTREYGGSGIGLSIVAASMQAHRKCYGVYNVENGVVFYFDLDIVNNQLS
jgi:signal transduction histidine kinase